MPPEVCDCLTGGYILYFLESSDHPSVQAVLNRLRAFAINVHYIEKVLQQLQSQDPFEIPIFMYRYVMSITNCV